MVVWVEEAVLDDPLLISDNKFQIIKDKLVTFRLVQWLFHINTIAINSIYIFVQGGERQSNRSNRFHCLPWRWWNAIICIIVISTICASCDGIPFGITWFFDTIPIWQFSGASHKCFRRFVELKIVFSVNSTFCDLTDATTALSN